MIAITIVVVVGAAFVLGGLIGSSLTNAMRESHRRGLSAPRPGGFPERRLNPIWIEPLDDDADEPPEVVASERIAL